MYTNPPLDTSEGIVPTHIADTNLLNPMSVRLSSWNAEKEN